MQKSKYIFYFFLISVIGGCLSSVHTSKRDSDWHPEYRLQAGINQGGIVENTDMDQVANAEVDAFTGATKTGFNTGIHVLLPYKAIAFESGIDYMYNYQTFTYNDPANGYTGIRKIGTSQFILPLTADLLLFRKKHSEGLVQFKLGYALEYNLFSVRDEQGTLPEYTLEHWSGGFIFGLSVNPYTFKDGSRLGLYLDAYRGGQIYEDYYNLGTFEMPGSSFYKLGVIYQLKTR